MTLIGRQAWSRFVTITKPIFQSELRWQASSMLVLLIALLLSVSGLNVVNSYVGRDFMTAICERQEHRFAFLALCYAGVFAVSTVVAGFCRFVEERLGLLWRDWLTRHLTSRYLAGQAYYRLNARGPIDNPDQRIAEDIKAFTTTTLSIVLILLNSAITLTAFSGILWSITPWLVVAAVGYAVFGSLLTLLLGHRMVGLDILQLKKEADFRYELIRVREHAEPIALLRGERQEDARLRGRLREVVDNAKRIIAVNRNLGFFTTGYNYLTQLIPVLIVAPLYMRSEIEFGTVTQAAMAFGHALGAFSVIVVEYQRLTAFAAVIARLGSFREAIVETPAAVGPQVEMVEDDARLGYDGLTLLTPEDGRLIVKDLSVDIARGQRLLITGPRGSGRTALLRAAAGLWVRGDGRIMRPNLEDVRFLPQRPYLVPGSLRDQLLYAAPDDGITDERILAVLRKVKFEPILDRMGGLDSERDWPAVLSLGEQQVLAFARLLLAHPRFAFLDEAVSAIDTHRGQFLYDLLSRTPITYISVANDPDLMDYHDVQLELRGQGAWRMVAHQRVVSA